MVIFEASWGVERLRWTLGGRLPSRGCARSQLAPLLHSAGWSLRGGTHQSNLNSLITSSLHFPHRREQQPRASEHDSEDAYEESEP